MAVCWQIYRKNVCSFSRKQVLLRLHGHLGLCESSGCSCSFKWYVRYAANRRKRNTAALEDKLTDEELSKLEKISNVLRKKIAVPCTGCRYCCDNCPQGLEIPSLLSAYNDYRDEAAALGNSDMASWRLFRLKALPEEKMPVACIGCGNCTAHCPQGLDIPLYMREMANLLK